MVNGFARCFGRIWFRVRDRRRGFRRGPSLVLLALVWLAGCAVSSADGAASGSQGGPEAESSGKAMPRYREVSESFHRSLFHILEDSRAVAARETRRHLTPNAPPKPARGVNRSAATANPDRLYRKARSLYEAGDFERARTGFDAFLTGFPDHSLGDNARYWIGECYYAQEQYREAGVHFRRVLVEYPDGNKVPDAFFKLGLCFHLRGDAETARTHWERLVRRYPDSRAAGLARRRLSRAENS